jgi:hypothetical protein
MLRAVAKSQISIYVKQKNDDILDVIFSEAVALDLSDLISDFIADRFNHLRTLFTIPQLRVDKRIRRANFVQIQEKTISESGPDSRLH